MLAAGGLGERRIVTALLCDVVGSTALGEHLGPERFKVVMDQLLGRIVAAVARYEGTVVQVMGDGLLAFFGAPLAHEDDPERALRAALDIRDAVATYAHDLEAAYGVTVQVRIGVNSGPVVISRLTDLLQISYNALGDTVTTAARLQTAAAPGAILAPEAMTRLAPLFEIRPIGPLALKGKEQPVPAVEVVRSRPFAGKVRGITGFTSPLVGRDRELALLSDSLRALTEGRGQILAVIGEAGIGKSRLIGEAQRLASGVRWLEGRCQSYAGAIPYFPFLDLFREWLGVTPADPEAKVRIELRAALDRLFGPRAAEVYPYLATLLRLPLDPDAAARLADLSAESLQHQTFKIVYEWAVRLAADRPLALVFDDLHWGDATSLALVEALLATTEEAAVLLALLFRAEREHGSWRVNDLARQRFPHRHMEISLHPLNPQSADQLLRNLLVSADFPREIHDLILQKAEGNPFFVEEVFRGLIDAGVLIREGNHWRAPRSVAAPDIPDSIQGVLLSRIDRLPAQPRRVLQAASVLGRLFTLETLKAVARADGKVETALAELQRLDMIVERRRIPVAEYRFKHHLIQEVAYGMLTEGERRRLHRQAALALEQEYAGRLEEAYALLAYHYDQAKDEERALHFLVRAGDKSRAEYADAEALRHYARSVDLMKQRGEWEMAANTLMKMALAHHIAFDFPAANQVYGEAFQIFDRLPPLPAAGRDTTLRIAMSEPASVDAAGSDIWSAWLASQIFEGLLHYAPESNIGLGVARSWEISADGTKYVFHLQKDRRWSDGRAVTADDFAFSWLRAMRGVFSHIFHDIRGARRYAEGTTDDVDSVGVQALDDSTLEVVLEGPRSYFPFIVAHAAALPQPRWVIDRFGEEWTAPNHLVGNGPYLLSQWDRGSRIRLVASPNYAGPRRGNVGHVHLVFKNAGDSALYERGDADIQMLWGLDREQARRLGGAVHIEPPADSWYLFFRCDQPPFDDRRLRLAFAHATDRQALARASPGAVPAEGGVVPPPIPGHSPEIHVPFDTEQAQRLLAEAGHPGGRGLGPFTMTIPGGINPASVMPIQAWREILGVHITVNPIPVVEHFNGLQTAPTPVGFAGWVADYPDPDSYLRLVFHSTSVHNYGRWRSARFDALVAEAQAATDQRRRMALYHDADRLLVAEEVAIIPLQYSPTIWLVAPRVKGWWSSPMGSARISDLTLEAQE